jgi:hypothetical protein
MWAWCSYFTTSTGFEFPILNGQQTYTWFMLHYSMLNVSDQWFMLHYSMLNVSDQWFMLHYSMLNVSDQWFMLHYSMLNVSDQWFMLHYSMLNVSDQWFMLHYSMLNAIDEQTNRWATTSTYLPSQRINQIAWVTKREWVSQMSPSLLVGSRPGLLRDSEWVRWVPVFW